MWMLPSGTRRPWTDGRRLWSIQEARTGLRSWEDLTVSELRDGLIHGRRYRLEWSGTVAFAQRCRPRFGFFPPAFDARVGTLCDLYVIHARAGRAGTTVEGGPELRVVPSALAGSDTADRVVADPEDLERWWDGCDAYREELHRVEVDLAGFWTGRRHRFSPSPWRQRRAFRKWRLMLAASYDRLAAASGDYRQVFDEMTEAIGETAHAYGDLTVRYRRRYDWEQRKQWCLVPTGEGFLIRRSEVAGGEPADAGNPQEFRWVYEEAKSQRYANLRPVDWDDESIRLCDRELADLSAASPAAGRLRSGSPMVGPAPASFAEWFHELVGPDHRGLSDRAALERERELRAEWRANPPSSRRDSRGTGGYLTDPGGHSGIHF